MKVLKFGGSSVGTPEAVLQVKQIVDRLDTSAVVVVSALGGVTDRLISLSAQAVDPAAADNIARAQLQDRYAT